MGQGIGIGIGIFMIMLWAKGGLRDFKRSGNLCDHSLLPAQHNQTVYLVGCKAWCECTEVTNCQPKSLDYDSVLTLAAVDLADTVEGSPNGAPETTGFWGVGDQLWTKVRGE